VFPFGDGVGSEVEIMIYGTVKFELKSGGGDTKEWAAKGVLVNVDGEVKWKEYHVWLDTAPPSK
jgi:hypothetical protein